MSLVCPIILIGLMFVATQSSTVVANIVNENEAKIIPSSNEDCSKSENLAKSSPQDDEDKSFEVEIPPGPGPDNKSVLGCSAEICFGVCLLQGRYGGCRRDKCKCKGKFP